jgi:prophage antirepressor-like protein
MSEIIPFQFESHSLRVQTDEQGNPWFNANDVCAALEMANPRDALAKHVDEEDVAKRDTPTAGGVQPVNHLNESGLYALILGSNKPEAKRFKRWVTSEVLPSIRKTGRYHAPTVTPTSPMLEAKLRIGQAAIEWLRMSDTSKIRLLSDIAASENVPTPFLPSYVHEGLTRSLTALLREHGSKLSAIAANLALTDAGVLEELDRPSSKGGTKKFRSLTDKGLQYGRNETSPKNVRETQPMYYAAKFPELLAIIERHAKGGDE